jgi:hypothetical protein
MKHSTARGMMEALAWMELPIAKFDIHLQEIEDETERKNMANLFAELMGIHFVDLMIPIIKQYPELNPDKDGAEWYKSIKDKYTVQN